VAFWNRNAKTKTQGDAGTRAWLSHWIVPFSFGAIVVVSIAVIAFAKDRDSASRYVFGVVVPLIGTWMGAVIAFYFTREALDSATKNTLALTGALTPDTPVASVMVPRAKITSHDLTGDRSGADQVALADLLKEMAAVDRHRIPILDASGAVVYVVHDSTINANSTAATVADLPADAQTAIKAIGFVALDAALKEARAKMSAIPGCNDVFVTKGGQGDELMLGWLTNTDLAGVQ
jgi:hypothetical protein